MDQDCPINSSSPTASRRPIDKSLRSTSEISPELRTSHTQDRPQIRMSLEAFRYHNVHQLHMLLFASPRSAQIRLKQLKDLGLLQPWRGIERPGITRCPSILVCPRAPREQESDPCPRPWI